MNWAQMYDCQGDVDRVPELLTRLERKDDAEAWEELDLRLVLEHSMVFPASFAALPRLVRLAQRNARARSLAAAIARCAAGSHGCDALLVGCADAFAELRDVLDRHLRSRPGDYLVTFLGLLAVEGQYHWSAALGDFADDFYEVACPHCAEAVTIAIGGYGRYSAIRDWNLGDVDRRDLRPASPADLSGTGRGMHEKCVRDGQAALAEGITYLFGRAECPRCASVFHVADEYASANCPVIPAYDPAWERDAAEDLRRDA
ncbi:hypothetical protein ABT026_10745 [Streptomyces sp. NPDC002734]|uniref:hypothetical protein n=1 Tax=Streptomyces sp. NPDC002734 TaxID=3154426 RepID=UPI00333101CB